MQKKIFSLVTLVLAAFLLISCSMPPLRPVTRAELMKSRVYNKYVIDESPEELLYGLNTRGEVIVEGRRNLPGKVFNVYVKLMATPDGVHVNEYDR